MSLYHELKRRNVLRVAVAYLAGAWFLIQVSDIIFPRLGLSDVVVTNFMLVLAVGFFAVDKFILDPARDTLKIEAATQKGRTEAVLKSYGDKSIAVLAFSDMSPDHDQEYFSDGIAEELLNVLATIRELRVISRSSALLSRGGPFL